MLHYKRLTQIRFLYRRSARRVSSHMKSSYLPRRLFKRAQPEERGGYFRGWLGGD